MKQRLSLARTLIHDPEVLILDEPASGLDPRARVEIRELLVELARMGKTIFFSTHILADVAEICTQVGIIEAGKLVALGGLEELHLQILPLRRIEVTLLGRVQAAQELLKTYRGITSIELIPMKSDSQRERLSFEFSGDDDALRSLLANLVSQEIPVLHFSEDNRDLEEVFLRATKGLVT
jgi:ABC-2 type transport system ATP-binding protein